MHTLEKYNRPDNLPRYLELFINKSIIFVEVKYKYESRQGKCEIR